MDDERSMFLLFEHFDQWILLTDELWPFRVQTNLLSSFAISIHGRSFAVWLPKSVSLKRFRTLGDSLVLACWRFKDLLGCDWLKNLSRFSAAVQSHFCIVSLILSSFSFSESVSEFKLKKSLDSFSDICLLVSRNFFISSYYALLLLLILCIWDNHFDTVKICFVIYIL